jgi:hypothetical protein
MICEAWNTLLLMLITLLVEVPTASAQTEDEERCAMECEVVRPCRGGATASTLKAAIAGDEVKELRLYAAGGADTKAWATSMLKPDGRNPLRGKDISKAGACKQNEYARWTCKYGARSAQDGNPRTVWAEGIKGDGLGELLLARLDTQKPAQIWAGSGASDSLHKKNGRPRMINVYVLQALEIDPDFQCENVYRRLKVLAKHQVELLDRNGYQPLPLPAHSLSKPSNQLRQTDPGSFVIVEIASVYPGTKYKDTCIAAIRSKPTP